MADDKIKRKERGWDDSNVIRNPRERKAHRITAEAEQRDPENGKGNLPSRRNSLPKKTPSPVGKIVKRTRSNPNQAPLYDVIEWEELLEMALARKSVNGKRKRDEGKGSDAGYLKDLEVLLENRAPQSIKVHIT